MPPFFRWWTGSLAAVALVPLSAWAQIPSTHDTIPTISCSTDPAIFNTGIQPAAGASGSDGYSITSGRKALGVLDDHWYFAPGTGQATWATVSGLYYQRATVNRPGAGNGAWVQSPYGNAQWLGYQGYAAPYYVYQYQFMLDPAVDPASFNVQFSMYVDDRLSRVYINEQQTHTFTPGVGGFGTNSQFSLVLAGPWQTGINTIHFVVANDSDPTGMLVQATGTAMCAPQVHVEKITTYTGLASAGTAFSYQVLVVNSGTSAVNGIQVADALPAGVVSNGNWSCAVAGHSGTPPSCPAASGAMPLNATVNLPAGSSLRYTIPVRFATTGLPPVITNTATITPPAGVSCAPTADHPSPCSASVSIASAPVVAIDKQVDTAGPIYPGEQAVFTVTVRNPGGVTLTNVNVQDILPAGFSGATWTCTKPPGSLADCPNASGVIAAAGALDQTIASLGRDASLVYTITATADAVTGLTPVHNLARIASVGNANAQCLVGSAMQPLAACTAAADTLISPLPELALDKTIVPAPAPGQVFLAGETVTYRLSLRNAGQVAIANPRLTDALPAGLENASWSCQGVGGADCPAATGTMPLDLTVASLAPGEGFDVDITATVVAEPPAQIDNIAEANAPLTVTRCSGAGAVPCQASASLVAAPAPQLALSKAASVSATTVGRSFAYTLVLANAGVSDAQQVTLSDPGVAGIVLEGWQCVVSSGAATCPVATGSGALNVTIPVLPAGSSLTFTLEAHAQRAGEFTNEAMAVNGTGVGGGCPGAPDANTCLATASVRVASVAGVPVDGPWALLSLAGLLAGLGLWRRTTEAAERR